MRDLSEIGSRYIGTKYVNGVRVDEYVTDFTEEERIEVVKDINRFFATLTLPKAEKKPEPLDLT